MRPQYTRIWSATFIRMGRSPQGASLLALFHPLLRYIQCWDAGESLLFDGEGGDSVSEVYCLAWLIMPVEVDQECGGEDIACSGWIDFHSRVSGECFLLAALEKGRAVPAVGCY